jgi:hypothetical protein
MVVAGDRPISTLETLREVDRSFRVVQGSPHSRPTTRYIANNGVRVELIAPEEALETEVGLLGYLAHKSQPAAILHGTGILVRVPAPERYAIHKLILSARRPPAPGRRDTDLYEATALLEALAKTRLTELKQACREAAEHGPAWQRRLHDGIAQLPSQVREIATEALPGPT